jgi:uncharacterized membrane protein YphA (DoxX/SURF4 family)
MRQENSISWIVLFLRLTLGILFLFSGTTFLFGLHFFTSPLAEAQPWFPVTYSLHLSNAIAAALGILGVLLMAGYRTAIVSIVTIVILLLIHLLWLGNNRLYNTLHHTVPYLLISLVILLLSTKHDKFSLDFLLQHETFSLPNHASFVAFCLRFFVGAIFLFQGHGSMANGPLNFARRLYVVPFKETLLPEAMLWVAGYLNPFVQLIGAIFLILGFKTFYTIIILGFFMISIVIGHMFINPYETGGDLTAYGLNNFLFLLGALYYASFGNKYSLDYFLIRKKASTLPG